MESFMSQLYHHLDSFYVIIFFGLV